MGSGGSKGDAKTSSKGTPQNTEVNNITKQKQQQEQRNGNVSQKSEVKGQQNNVKPVTAAGKENDINDVRRRASEGKLLLRQRTLFQHARDANTHLDNDGNIHSIFRGDISANAQSTSKVVRIFTSSTFTDTGSERNILMDKAYPKIKSYCQDRGYEFQVVDMRWGVRDESTDDHMVNEICLREVKLCKELSTGPNFVLLLSHKYGSRALLREIEADDFEKIYQAINSEDDKKLINKWFKRDDNAVPPVYVLQPISKYIPDFLSDDSDKKQTAKNLWNEESSQMKEIFANIAKEKLEPDKSWKYIVSITEWEVQLGMLQCFDAHKACVWFKRTISDIGKQKPDKLLSRYIECIGPEDQQKKARELHHKLTEEKIPGILPKDQILNYSVNWSSKGIDPDNKEHKKYLEQLSNDFVKKICKMVDDGIKERSTSEISDPLYEECYLHSSFCKNKCLDFQGREETLKKIESYIIGKSCFPLVIHGVSGCGKTSIVAKAAYLSWQWMNEKAAIILRFVGTTPDSSNINDFLASVTLQIKKNYGEDSSIPEDLKELIQEFQTSLSLARWNHPLVLVIDSLDQFDPANGARVLSWLPDTLPPHVKLIVSTLEDEEYESFPKLKSMKIPKDNFIAVPKLPDQDVSNIVDHWLAKRKRTLTSSQRQVLSKSFEKCPLPIYLKLSFDEACRWTSYSDKSTTVLQTTVRNSINTLFSRLEVKHGETFVSRALGYLTEARSGLSTSELEDVLACDDEALQNVYSRRPPPIRRLPPLYLVRLKSDLQQYLVERGADGIRVLFWYHRQFIEAANDRYCKIVEKLNAGLAEFFSGTWADGKPKPYTDGSGVETSADRHVTSQPLQFGNSYNIRKINNLPHHRTLAGHLDLLKKECLCNFEFILAKLLTSSIRQVIEDYALAKKKFPEDKEISLITDALQLSQSALIYDPLQLAPQMLDRMAGEQVMLPFLKQCEAISIPFLKPSTEILIKPGGQLVYCLAGHTEPVRAVDMKKNGREVVTCSEDDTIKTWDIIEGHMIKSYDGLGIDPDNVLFIMNDKFILAHYPQRIKGIRQAGDIVYTIELSGTGAAYGVAGKNKSIIAVFENQMAKLYDAETGNLLNTVEHPDNVQFQEEGCVAGSEHYMVIRSQDNKRFSVLNLAKRSFSQFSEAFPGDPKTGQADIEGLVISMNEKFILCTNNISSNIYIFDINSLKREDELKESEPFGNIQKKGYKKNFSQNLHLTYNGNFLYCPSNKYISVKNMKTGSVEHVLEHPADVDDVVSVDGKRFVTRSDDVVIRVWDLSRKEKEAGVSDLSHSDNVKKMEPLPNSRYVVCLSRAVNKSTADVALYLQVYDLGENVIVRQAEVMDSDARILKVLNNNEIIIATLYRKLKVIDLNSMKVVRVFQGKVHKELHDILVLKEGKEVVVTTRGQEGLKIYDTNTGKVKTIIKTPNSEEIEEIKGSNDGSVVLARTSDGPYLIFDIKKGKLIRSLVEDDFGFIDFLSVESMISSSMISSNGSYIGITGTKSIPIPTLDGEKSDENMMCIWDVKAGKKLQDLYDEEYHTKYETKDNRKGLSIGLDEAVNLGDSLILTAHDDFIVRVWDIKSGKLIKRLFGHTTNVQLRVIDNSPYILTYGCWEEENALRLWDKASYECLATYKLDKLLSKNTWCTDGISFISTMNNPAKMIHWKLHGTNTLSNTSKCPVIFKEKKCDLEIEFESEDDNLDDPSDPDQNADYDD